MNRILDTKLKTSKMILHNRLVMPPMQTQKCTDEGYVTDEVIDYYEKRVKTGKIGLVIVEHTFVSEEGRACERQMSAAQDDCIIGLRRLADTIKQYGSKACLQITHAGGSAYLKGTELEAVGPSDIKCIRTGVKPRAMTQKEIQNTVIAFGEAARRAKSAGFDCVEIHSAHGYLLNQFLSPYSNRRFDEYGGSIDNRIRIHKEIIQAVREYAGEDYPILLRIGAKDYFVEGTTIEEGIYASVEFEKCGIDILDVSGGMSIWKNPNDNGPGFFKELSIPIRKAVSIPVILTGGVMTGAQAEELLKEEAADLIGVGRAIFNDADWTRKNI